MKTVNHFHSADLNWIEVLAKAIGGIIDGNFIKGNNELYTGVHFIFEIENELTAMLVDVTYKENVMLRFRTDDDFVGLYFYVTNHDIDFILKEKSVIIGKQDYNLSLVSSEIDLDYVIDQGTMVYAICIFIDQLALKQYIDKVPSLTSLSNDLFDNEKNTIISMDRMNIDSLILINNFRKMSYENSLLELYFRGLVYQLLGNYLEQLLAKKFIISKVMNVDVKSILASKAMLLESIEGVFPGIDFLARQAAMSSSKYKKIFTKITGLSPGSFFYSNKLQRAKELLETGQYTVGEVSDKLNYANISYLAKRFNSKYGVFPKDYQNLL
ncbi:helix-turn-helix transcriptional regulator [Flavobacterium sp. 3-210]